jgi:hypothetical protein
MTAKYALYSAVLGTFFKIDHILGHKANLNKYKKIKVIPCLLSDQSGIKLKSTEKENYRKY